MPAYGFVYGGIRRKKIKGEITYRIILSVKLPQNRHSRSELSIVRLCAGVTIGSRCAFSDKIRSYLKIVDYVQGQGVDLV
jgi:hypothetical protein